VLRDPRVLVLDEATSALDPRTEHNIAETLGKIGHGRTTVAVTHRLTSVVHYDVIFVMEDGKLVEHGTHDELVANDGVYAHLWSEQTGGHVPSEAPFAVEEALGRLSLFAELQRSELEAVAARMRAISLAPGETIPEGGGRLLVVRNGHARTLVPGLTGRLVPASDLRPGDAFGVTALLGQPMGAVLEAVDEVRLLALDDDAITGLSAAFPSVAAALAGARPPTAVPAGGTRLSRMTLAPLAAPPPPAPAVDVAAIRRASGAFLTVRP
jgi:ATP-binding cassette subfamily B protein